MYYLRVSKVASAIAVAFLLLSGLTSCKEKNGSINPAFARYISAFTSGTISAAGNIRIRLTDVFAENIVLNEPIKEKWIDFSPNIEGDLIWIDTQTLEFRPKEWLKRGETYHAEFELGKLIKLPSNLHDFEFNFTVLSQNMDCEIRQIKPYRTDDLRWMSMSGIVRLIDVADISELEKTLSAAGSGKTLPITWTHSEDKHLHYFTVDSVERKISPCIVDFNWNGKAIGAEQSGSRTIEIPALDDFKVFFHAVNQHPEQYIILQFSDPLDPSQNLSGLVDLVNDGAERLTIESNEVKLYPSYRFAGNTEIHIHQGVKNISGVASKQEQVFSVSFEDLKPDVEIPDKDRVILPSTNGLVFPFRAVNLSAVDVEIIRIFENNIPQFLQVNALDGNREMSRVGRKILKKTVQLNSDGKTNLATWNTFYLNLDEIIKTEPGAVYRVAISFIKRYSLYHCEGDDDDKYDGNMQPLSGNWNESEEEEYSDWNYYEDYYYEDYYYDEYGDRGNPCSEEYYSGRAKSKNILASDIGIIAKNGVDNTCHFFVTDIRTSKPISGAELDVLNFQNQSIGKIKTDSEGKAVIPISGGKPYLLVAKKDKQRGYLKLDDSHSLSTSTFDVGGSATESGMKGFIYGERGVWRPGDTLFLSFILEDERQLLPEGHPVNFELVNPRGQVIRKMVKSKGENGFYRFTTPTDSDAETGNYAANIRVGGATFSKSLKIETIKPNRLKLSLNFGTEKITSLNKDVRGTLTAKWLHGASARNLKAMVSSSYSQSSTSFNQYSDYVFDDPVRSFSGEEKIIFEGYTNNEGVANISFDTDLSNRAPGMVNANFSVKVFEEGGDFSVDRFTIPYAPYSHFAGIRLPKGDKMRNMLLTDTDQKVDVITVDANGKAVARKNIQWKLYKVAWRWWWEKSSNDLANYTGSESTTPVAEGSITTNSDGRGSFSFQVHYPDWGRYLVRVEDPGSGHATGQTVYFDWPGWAGRAQRENPGGASMLVFSTNKEKYTVGEECEISFPSSGIGRALVSIENGTRILEAHWVEAKKEQTVFKFKTTAEMAPNAFINVTLIQPHDQTANDLPIRLYGIMPLLVENPGSHIDPIISVKEELEPGKEFEVKVSEKSGKAMTYTLAIVEEGLLDLTRYKTPDPWNYFYAREALGINTFDLYDQVIGAFGSKLERLLSIGGSDEAVGKGKSKINRFKPVVMYAGPFTMDAKQSKTHKFVMPDYVGSVRVMVVAGKDPAYGNAEKTVLVKKPLMVLASLPRVLGPGEEVKLPVTVFAMEKSIKNVTGKVEVNDFFTLNGNATQEIKFNEPGEDVINFAMKVKEKTGKGKVKVTVSSGNFKSTYEVEMEVRSPNPSLTTVKSAVIEPGQQWSAGYDAVGMAGTNSTVLEVSSIPPVDFGRRLQYLLEYPHGCIEQITSGAFPQLYLSDVMEIDEKLSRRADDNVKAAISQFTKFQTSGGGLSYWPGEAQVSDWGTTYAGHFMIEAEQHGFTLPAGWKNAWLAYQKRTAQNWRQADSKSGNYYWRESDLDQAYRLYSLALAAQPETGAMNRLRELPGLSIAAKWRLAAAYALAGNKETAEKIVQGLSSSVAPYRSLGYTYGSGERDEAMIVETMVLLGKKTEAADLVKILSNKLSSERWYSTQTTAYSLIAISKFAGNNAGKDIRYVCTLNGKSSPEFVSQKAMTNESLNDKLKGNIIEVKNTSKSLLYARIITKGVPLNGNETTAGNGLRMSVSYFDMKNRPIDIGHIDQGTDFIAEVSVTHPGIDEPYSELALTQIFPSGWEIINSRMDASAIVSNADQPEFLDIRDDRVYTYFDLYRNQTKKFRVKLNATYIGRFYLPAVNCEAMYDAGINARTKGQWVEVVRSGSVAMKQ
ncbi:MAG: hypothetical protein IT223_02695 [Crocinitomicaceae bacterium]|nr:hypothetical protein [Crocinitomicaceae bacterium]